MESVQDVALEEGEFVIDQIVSVLKESATITEVVTNLTNIAHDLGVIYIPSLSDEIGPPSGTLRSFLIQFKTQRGREATSRTFCEALQKTNQQQAAAEQLERGLLSSIPVVTLSEGVSDGQGQDNPSFENKISTNCERPPTCSNSPEHEQHENGGETVLEQVSSDRPISINVENTAYNDNDESADLLTRDDNADYQLESCCRVHFCCYQLCSRISPKTAWIRVTGILLLLAVIGSFGTYIFWPEIEEHHVPAPITIAPVPNSTFDPITTFLPTTLSPTTFPSTTVPAPTSPLTTSPSITTVPPTSTPSSIAAPFTAESEKRIHGKSFGHPRGSRSSDIIFHNYSNLSFHLTNTSCSSGTITRDLYPEDQIQLLTSIVFGMENSNLFSGVECDITYEIIPIVPGKPSEGFFKMQVMNPYLGKNKVNTLGSGKFFVNTMLQRGNHNKVEFSLYNET